MCADTEVRSSVERERAYHDAAYAGEVGRIVRSYPYLRLHRHMLDQLWSWGVLSTRSVVVSLGCGAGDIEVALARRCALVLALDLSAVAVRQAANAALVSGASNAQFLVADATQLPMRPGAADVVFAPALLHHLPDNTLPSVLGDANRVLRSGGRFCSIDPSAMRLVGGIGRRWFGRLYRRHHSPDERELVPLALAALAQQAGYRAVRVRPIDFAIGPLAWLLPTMPPRLFDLLLWADGVLLRVPVLNRFASSFVLEAIT